MLAVEDDAVIQSVEQFSELWTVLQQSKYVTKYHQISPIVPVVRPAAAVFWLVMFVIIVSASLVTDQIEEQAD